MTGRGRPEIVGRVVEVKLPHDLLARVDTLAMRAQVPRAEMIRQLLAEAARIRMALAEVADRS